MFGKKTVDMDMIVTTSKMALKASCIRACGNDIQKATELYDFFIKDMTTLPDFDIVPPSMMTQVKDFIGNALGWIDQNQEKIMGYYHFFQQLKSGQGNTITEQPSEIPPPIPERR